MNINAIIQTATEIVEDTLALADQQVDTYLTDTTFGRLRIRSLGNEHYQVTGNNVGLEGTKATVSNFLVYEAINIGEDNEWASGYDLNL